MAARTEDKRFGAFKLDDTNGINLDSWNNRLIRRIGFSPMLKGDGSIRTMDGFDGHEIRLAGQVFGTDTGDVDTKLGNLLDHLSDNEDNLRLFDDREILASLAGAVNYKLRPNTGGLVYDWSAKFRSRFPTWRATSESSDVENESGSGPFSITLGAGGGDANSPPVFKIENTGSSFSDKFILLTHTNTLKQFQLIGISMNAGQILYVDMEEGRVGDGLATAVRPFAVAGVFFDLRPSSANDIQVVHTIGSGASLKFTTTWFARYWSI